jgi:hypothetical protein
MPITFNKKGKLGIWEPDLYKDGYLVSENCLPCNCYNFHCYGLCAELLYETNPNMNLMKQDRVSAPTSSCFADAYKRSSRLLI